MMTMIAVGADHRGFLLKEAIKEKKIDGITWLDKGAFDSNRSDYPIIAHSVCQSILSGESTKGILSCGTGVGMAMAANRHRHIYAAVAWNREIAQRSVMEDHSNVLVLPADYLSLLDAIELVEIWLSKKPQPGRFADRIAMVDKL